VFEGTHGFYKAFAPSRSPDFGELLGGLGERWVTASIAFKPYACGTMAQPFIDCAVEAAAILASRGIALEEIESMVCKVGEGTVHRLWEPLAGKHAPPNGYAGKFSTPYCIAVGLVDRRAGLEQFTDERVRDPRLRALAARIRYVVDPGNEYPRNYSGHLRVTLKDGSVIETEQPHLRGGAKEPLSDADIAAKFAANVHFGGGSEAMAAQLLEAVSSIADGGRVHLKMTP
jgi:2-methylcitrate dehydratase PrpD